MATRIIQVRVKPNSRASELVEQEDGTWLARVKSPPTDGRANRELIRIVCQHFELREGQVSIKRGAAGRTKLIQLTE